MATLAVPKRSTRHARTVTRFCDEANIGSDDQLDLAEFIVAAHYLGAGVDDGKLMDIFAKMEDAVDNSNKSPKELIKELMKQVEEEAALDNLNGDSGGGDDGKADEEKDDTEHEIVGKTLKDAVMAEDAQWQDIQIDGFLSAAEQHQNIQIAKKLMQDTALTTQDVAQITGVDAKLLAEYENEDDNDEDYETEDDVDESKVAAVDSNDGKLESSGGNKDGDAVVIKSTEFGKSIALTTGDLEKLDDIIKGGKEEVGKNDESVLVLLKKLRQAVKLSPGGATTLKAQRTLKRLDQQQASVEVNDTEDETDDDTNDKNDKNDKKGHSKTKSLQAPKLENTSSEYKLNDDYDISGIKFPCKFRVVITPGALVKSTVDIRSSEVAKVPIGTVVIVENIDGRRAKISTPVAGWVSLHAKDGRTILQKENTTSKEMENAVHAQRARQTKILILKSITTLNDATVTRILEKSDWNLRRAIEAFYMAKYKTQQFIEKKEKAAAEAEAKAETEAQGKGKGKEDENGNVKKADNKNEKGDKKARRKTIAGWWSSWKTFSHQNK